MSSKRRYFNTFFTILAISLLLFVGTVNGNDEDRFGEPTIAEVSRDQVGDLNEPGMIYYDETRE